MTSSHACAVVVMGVLAGRGRRRVPPELLEGEDGVRLDSLDWLRGTLDEVENLAIGRLLSQEVTP